VISITCDNATSNNSIVAELAFDLLSFEEERDWTHCFMHIINLVAKSLLKMFD
ncbi:hypothetical protein BT96DRAFT_766233, partial [Gymnopus androsaceus JB14]